MGQCPIDTTSEIHKDTGGLSKPVSSLPHGSAMGALRHSWKLREREPVKEIGCLQWFGQLKAKEPNRLCLCSLKELVAFEAIASKKVHKALMCQLLGHPPPKKKTQNSWP